MVAGPLCRARRQVRAAGRSGPSGRQPTAGIGSGAAPGELVAAAVRAYAGDGSAPTVVVADGTRPAWRADSFTRVLVDVPCSGLGALRRRPESRWRRGPADVEQLHPLQLALLASAIDSAAPGGVVGYVTCSPHRRETSDVLSETLAVRADVEVIPAAQLLPEVPTLLWARTCSSGRIDTARTPCSRATCARPAHTRVGIVALRIMPSILSADFANLQTAIESVPSSDAIHVDVMDNHFVPNLTLGLPVVESIRKITDKILDIHLMIEQPDRWAPAYAEAGAESVTFHVEAAGAPVRLARELRKLGARAAMALKPATPIEPYEDLLPELDMVLIMTVEPGFGGQSFLDMCLPKITRTRAMLDKLGGDIWLQIDGGVSAETIERCAAAGVDSFVAGSSVFGADDPDAMVAKLRDGDRGGLETAWQCVGCSKPNVGSRAAVWTSERPTVRRRATRKARLHRRSASLARPSLALATPQVALELGRDRIAAGLRQLGCVLHLLQRRDVLGDLGVLGSQLVDAALPRPGQLGQFTKIEGGVQHPLQLGEQRQRGLRARRVRDVVRNSRPQCEDVHTSARQGVAEYADDAGRTLIASMAPGRAASSTRGSGSTPTPGSGGCAGCRQAGRPSRCTRVTFAELSADAIMVLNCRHRRLGSRPWTKIRSRPSGSSAIFSSVVGQVISRSSSSVMLTRGRG